VEDLEVGIFLPLFASKVAEENLLGQFFLVAVEMVEMEMEGVKV